MQEISAEIVVWREAGEWVRNMRGTRALGTGCARPPADALVAAAGT